MEAVDGHENKGIENGDEGETNVEKSVDHAEVGEELRKPNTPTKTQVYEHEVTHLPYRSWCWHCVFGRGVSSPHPKPDGKEKIGITISLDYCFMSGEGDEDPDLPGMLIVWDDSHECLWATPVDKKGPTD